jgi:hypothetical protein
MSPAVIALSVHEMRWLLSGERQAVAPTNSATPRGGVSQPLVPPFREDHRLSGTPARTLEKQFPWVGHRQFQINT